MKMVFVVLLLGVALSPAFGSSVYYDLSLEPGVFEVQVIQSMKNPLPQFALFQSSSTTTVVTDEYAYDAREDSELPVEVVIPKDRAIIRAGLKTASVFDNTAEVIMGAVYFDDASLQYEGDRVLFVRETNIHDITILLPSEYAVIYVDQPATITVNADGRVVLNIKNPRAEMLKINVVAHRSWGQQLRPELSLTEAP